MRSYGVPQILDLLSNGSSSVSLTPGATTQKAEFLISAPRAGVGDNWPLCTNLVCRARTTFDQAASGGNTVNWDELPAVMDSFDVNSPILGNTHPKDTFTGPITKHIAEFVSSGYSYADGGRTQIASTDGDTTLDVYYVLPFEHACFERPHHSAVWLGWLKDTKITTYLAAASVLGSLSTGAVIKAPTNVQMWAEYIVSDELIMPWMNNFHRYQAPAAGGTTAILSGIGTANGYNDVLNGSRILGLFELMGVTSNSFNLMGGPTTADQYTSVTIPQLNQDVTVNIDGFFASYWRAIGGHRGPISNAAGSALFDRAGNPNIMRMSQANQTGDVLNSADAMYIPWKAPGRDQMLSKAVKFFGDLKMTRTFGTAPTSGTFYFVLNEGRELGDAKKQQMIQATGKSGTLETIWGGGSKGTADNARHPRRDAVLPERVVFTS